MIVDEYVDLEEYNRVYGNYFEMLYEYEQLLDFVKHHAPLTYQAYKAKDLKL